MVAVRIVISTIIVQRLHSGNSNRNLGETFAPGTPETISDDDWDRKVQAFFKFAMELSCGTVRIFGKQKRVTAAIDIRGIYPAIGADQAMAGFRDQNSTFASHYSLTLCESNFRYSRVEIVTACPSAGTRRGLDFVEGSELAFRLGYDLMFHDEDVACSQRQLRMPESLEKFARQRVSGTDFSRENDGDDAQLAGFVEGRHAVPYAR